MNAAALRAAVLVSCLAASGFGAFAAQAQGRPTDGRPCTEIENDSERLACYDRSLRPSRPVAAPAATAAPEAPPAPVAGAQPPREVRNATPAAASTPPPAPVAAEPRSTTKAAPSKDPIEVVIVNVRGPNGRSIFTSETGDVYVQTDDRTGLLPKLPFRAAVKPGFSGSFFLVPVDGRAIRVRRGQ